MDPEEHLIEAFRLAEGAWLRLGAWLGDTKARTPPFDAVDWIWPRPGRKKPAAESDIRNHPVVAPHEAGHFLGLAHDERPSLPEGFIMKRFVEEQGPQVSQRDVNQIAGLVVRGTEKAREARPGEAVTGYVKAFTTMPTEPNKLVVPPRVKPEEASSAHAPSNTKVDNTPDQSDQ